MKYFKNQKESSESSDIDSYLSESEYCDNELIKVWVIYINSFRQVALLNSVIKRDDSSLK